MIDLNVKIENLDKLQKNLSKSPATFKKYLSRAVIASVFEVEKQAVDKNFRFKTPRALRTGMLGLSFKQGIKYYAGGLKASIGPTVKYAPYVYYGTRRGIRPNPYMDRIVKASEKPVEKHFNTAVNKALNEISV